MSLNATSYSKNLDKVQNSEIIRLLLKWVYSKALGDTRLSILSYILLVSDQTELSSFTSRFLMAVPPVRLLGYLKVLGRPSSISSLLLKLFFFCQIYVHLTLNSLFYLFSTILAIFIYQTTLKSNILMICSGSFQAICMKIVCPTRHTAFNQHDMISRRFRKNPPPYEIFSVCNQSGNLLSVVSIIFDLQNLPTVLYLHGNGGHKMESLQLTNPRINIVSFDFGACGKSQGDYLTYGQKEAKDIGSVVNQLKRRYGIKRVVIWGRSMGASLGIMYASLFPRDVSCLVLDSPFRWLKAVVKNVAQYNNASIPSFLLNIGLYIIENKLNEMIGLNIFQTDFKMYLNLLQVPAYFVYSMNDSVVKQQEVKQLFQAYKGEKVLKHISAMHHEDRPKLMIEQAIKFILGDEDTIKSSRTQASLSSKKGISMSLRNDIY